MSTAGLSPARLDRMREVMTGYVESGAIPGLVTLVSRRGETHVDAIGAMAVGGSPMRRDTIFRIASMTKPIAAAAAMILVEEGRLRLDEPIDPLLPELADRQVLCQIDSPIDDTVPADRPITLRDVLTLRLGYGIILAPTDSYPIQRLERELGLEPGPPQPGKLPPPDEWLRRLGTMPLLHQPGERWLYNIGSYVLGILVARAAGQSFDAFLRDRVFAPLGMKDTGFSVPAESIDRLATSYSPDSETGELAVYDDAVCGQWSQPPAFPTGAGGLVSTVDDYLSFSQMLLNGGRLGGERILSRPSVELMTTNHLTPGQTAGSEILLGEGFGWGFGLSVVTRRDDQRSVGTFGWDGGLGTTAYMDPSEELVTILLTQVAWLSPAGPQVATDFKTLAYAAIDD